mmetsp:Transcript_44799/g.113434  ORF Transcript_44799/g.113434 Transcript_44799/m.113434 type:complete len:193 (+) Transcript_44799:918-1496(+)
MRGVPSAFPEGRGVGDTQGICCMQDVGSILEETGFGPNLAESCSGIAGGIRGRNDGYGACRDMPGGDACESSLCDFAKDFRDARCNGLQDCLRRAGDEGVRVPETTSGSRDERSAHTRGVRDGTGLIPRRRGSTATGGNKDGVGVGIATRNPWSNTAGHFAGSIRAAATWPSLAKNEVDNLPCSLCGPLPKT